MASGTPEQRFWTKVDKRGKNECWGWKASTLPFGYGQISVNYKNVAAHRFSWELHNGPIPDGLQILHKCNNPACCNPRHLYAGTQKDNMRDKKRAGRQNMWGRDNPSARGESNPNAKLTGAIVRKSRKEYKQGNVTLRDLAEKYNVSKDTMHRAIIGKTWKYI